MYTRFYNSIISPKYIVEFRNDALWKVLLYIAFFALLLSTRMTIETITFDGVSQAAREEVISAIEEVDESCAIVQSTLECTSSKSTLVYQNAVMSFYTDSRDLTELDDYDTSYNLVFHEDSMKLVFSGLVLTEIPISELPATFHNLDFSDFSTNGEAFVEMLIDGVDDYLVSTKVFWGTGAVLFDFLGNLFIFMMFIMLSAYMLRLRFRMIKFKQLFVMTAYSSTALYLILIINSLYSLSFFIVIILIFIAIRQNSQLSMEMYKRIQKKVDK